MAGNLFKYAILVYLNKFVEGYMVKVGDKVYCWDELNQQIKLQFIYSASPVRVIDNVPIIGEITRIVNNYARIELVTIENTIVTISTTNLFKVGTGPILSLGDEDGESSNGN